MENGSGENKNNARLAIMELANMISVPMSLNAVVKLKVADAIWDAGSNKPLSSAEILAKIPAFKHGDADNLQRILRMMASYGVFNEHIVDDASQRRYSLTEVGETLVTDENGLSCGPYILQHHQEELVKAWNMIHEAVIDSSAEPFVRANGEPAFDYYGKRPEMNSLMVDAMTGVSVPFMKAILEKYDGFQGVNTLVDVGGSGGNCLKMILEKHPSIQLGINFDLPEVVEEAPIIPRVKHIGGDMFKYIPEGDAIFLKWVLVAWTEDECKQLLKNCYNALPEKGKCIVCDPVLPHHTDDSKRTRALLGGDILVMAVHRPKAKNRTEEEYRLLGRSAGFAECRSFYIDQYFTIIEFHK